MLEAVEKLLEGPVNLGDVEWLIDQISRLPDDKISLRVSEWAEKNRYLPSELTEDPGPWDNSFMPFLTEIMDDLGPDSPARDIGVMKSRQMGITTGPIENWIGYIIDIDPGPTMYLTASDKVSKISIEVKLDRMISSSNIEHKIRGTVRSGRKLSGNTSSRKDFLDGFLLNSGGQSTASLKGISIKYLIIDELDEIPSALKQQGSVVELAKSQQMAYDKTRKTFYSSTPILMNGPIHKIFKSGDQRYYYVPCQFCGYEQILEFHGRREDGEAYGIYYEVEKENRLIFSSVEYRCKNCLKGWKNTDKYDFLNAGEWRPTETPIHPFFYTYYLDGLYSPKFSWESLVQSWLTCWNENKRRIYDVEALKVFQNTKRGLPFEERGQSPKFENVVQHRRAIYSAGEIPNKKALKETGSPVLAVTAAADIHGDRIDVEVKGWCVDSRSYSIQWLHLMGDGSDVNSKAWDQLADLVENKIYEADDGKKYQIALTLVDARWQTSVVYDFCSRYSDGVYPIMGRDMPVANARWDNFAEYRKKGIIAYNITVTLYKDRMAAWLRKDWNSGELQPYGYPNFPQDYGDDYFREYEAEHKQEKLYSTGAQRRRFVWVEKDQNLPNHAWDCAIYNACAIDMLCYQTNLFGMEQDRMDYTAFWSYIAENKSYYFE